ncbi:MAG: hypothetical protein WC539_00745 [Nitrospirota bacterium]
MNISFPIKKRTRDAPNASARFAAYKMGSDELPRGLIAEYVLVQSVPESYNKLKNCKIPVSPSNAAEIKKMIMQPFRFFRLSGAAYKSPPNSKCRYLPNSERAHFEFIEKKELTKILASNKIVRIITALGIAAPLVYPGINLHKIIASIAAIPNTLSPDFEKNIDTANKAVRMVSIFSKVPFVSLLPITFS